MFIPVPPITDIRPRNGLFRESRQTPDHPTKLRRRSRIRRMSLLLAKGRIKTMLFRGRGGSDNAEGTMMVWLVERRRGWVCFGSVWFGGNVWFP